MIEKLKNWLFGVIVAIAFALTVIGAFGHCKGPVGTSSAKIDTIILEHRDTIVKIDSILKVKVKVVHDLAPDPTDSLFDSIIPNDTIYLPSDTTTKTITVYQEKKCIEAVDSLQAYKQIVHVDSQTIDSLAKIGKEKASPTLIDDAKKVGIGFLLGFATRSVF